MPGVAGRSGRHKTPSSRAHKVALRLTKEEQEMITGYAKEKNLTIAQVLVDGFNLFKAKNPAIK